MVREPPPRRNDAALLSKIASQEKLRAERPPSFASLCPMEHPLYLPPKPGDRSVSSPAGIDTMAPGIRRILR